MWVAPWNACRRITPREYAFLKKQRENWPFIRYVLYNAETSLASADLGIMKEYASLVSDAALRNAQFKRIKGEYLRTERMLEDFFGAPRAERRPRLTRTLEMRAEGLRCLHAIQIALLREWRDLRSRRRKKEADALVPTLLLSVNAIASGERTTG